MLKNKKKSILGKIIAIGIIGYAFWETFVNFYPHKTKYVTLTDEEVEKITISKEDTLILYQLMKDADEIFKANNIDYWILGGTLLGAKRNKGMIKYDDDLDVAIKRDDELKFLDSIESFTRIGYKVNLSLHAYTICNGHCMDVFVFHQKNNKWIYTNLNSFKTWKNGWFNDEDVFPLVEYNFGSLKVQGPKSADRYLNRMYPDWDKYAIIQQPHKYHISVNKIQENIKYILTPKLLEPAKPFGPLLDRNKENNYDF